MLQTMGWAGHAGPNLWRVTANAIRGMRSARRHQAATRHIACGSEFSTSCQIARSAGAELGEPVKLQVFAMHGMARYQDRVLSSASTHDLRQR
jgi:hypothetical protein